MKLVPSELAGDGGEHHKQSEPYQGLYAGKPIIQDHVQHYSPLDQNQIYDSLFSTPGSSVVIQNEFSLITRWVYQILISVDFGSQRSWLMRIILLQLCRQNLDLWDKWMQLI